MQRNVELEATIVAKYAAVSPVLDERSRRRWAAAESVAIGYGGDALVSSATGLARETLRKGRREITQGGTPTGRIRRPGAGRPRLEQRQPGLLAALEGLVDPLTRGDLHHLGQVLAYLAGLEAKTVVWIAKGFEDRSSVRSPLAERAHGRVLRVLSSFTGVIAPEADLRARSLVNREADGYGLISATLFELGEAGSVVSTEVAV